MIVDERLVAYINSIDTDNTQLLNQIEAEALADNVPIIRKETQSLLKTLLALKAPKNILEAGAAVGFSAILMATYGPDDCHITTMENYDKRIPVAKSNIKRAGLEDRIKLLEGDATAIMEELEESFDMIFIDSAKGQYLAMLPIAVRLLKSGGLLVSDNVLQDGEIIESRYAVTRRNRTIHSRMRDYLYEIKHHPELISSILPVGDGVTVSVIQRSLVEFCKFLKK